MKDYVVLNVKTKEINNLEVLRIENDLIYTSMGEFNENGQNLNDLYHNYKLLKLTDNIKSEILAHKLNSELDDVVKKSKNTIPNRLFSQNEEVVYRFYDNNIILNNFLNYRFYLIKCIRDMSQPNKSFMKIVPWYRLFKKEKMINFQQKKHH